MRSLLYFVVIWLLTFLPTFAFPREGARPTVDAFAFDETVGWSPKPTTPPPIRVRPGLLKRETSDIISSHVCGFLNGGDIGQTWDSYNQATCIFNSDAHVAGLPLNTVCVDWDPNNIIECGISCTDTSQCPSSRPYCVTASFPSSYSAFGCSTFQDGPFTYSWTWNTLTSVIHFPTFSGSNGLSVGTQTPAGYSAAATSDLSQTTSATTSASARISSLSSLPNATTTILTSATSSPKPNNAGAIAGGTVGGILAICGTAIIIAWFRYRHSHSSPTNQSQPVENTPTPAPAQQTQQAYSQYPAYLSKPEMDSNDRVQQLDGAPLCEAPAGTANMI